MPLIQKWDDIEIINPENDKYILTFIYHDLIIANQMNALIKQVKVSQSINHNTGVITLIIAINTNDVVIHDTKVSHHDNIALTWLYAGLINFWSIAYLDNPTVQHLSITPLIQ